MHHAHTRSHVYALKGITYPICMHYKVSHTPYGVNIPGSNVQEAFQNRARQQDVLHFSGSVSQLPGRHRIQVSHASHTHTSLHLCNEKIVHV
jgi:hypothetical protein